MTDAELWAAWRLWMAVGAAVVLVAAALLVSIWLTARSIVGHARRALAAAETIRATTAPIWALETTNEVARDLLDTVRAIETKGVALVAALAGHASAGAGAGRRPT
jgi:hypothetical protein